MRCEPAIRLILLTLLAGWLSGCSSIDVVRHFDSKTDFSGYRTFAFISEHPMISTDLGGNPQAEPRIMAAIVKELTAKQFVQAESADAADLVIAFTLGSREQMRADNYPKEYQPSYGTWNDGRIGYYGVGGSSRAETGIYTEGQLAIDLIEVRSHRPVYHVIATKALTPGDLREGEALVRKVVHQMFAEFPPDA